MLKIELQQQVNKLESALSRAETTKKKRLDQINTYKDAFTEKEDEIRRLNRLNKTLRLKCQDLTTDNSSLVKETIYLKEELEKTNKQNTILRHKVEMLQASSTAPRWDTLIDR